jgi:hypothetical protein
MPGDPITGKGRLWAEYWIDCCRCEFHWPTGRRTRAEAMTEARCAGWRLTRNGWVCPNHEETSDAD